MPTPVSANRRLALLCLSAPLWIALQACVPPGAVTSQPASLLGTEWELQTLDDQPLIEDAPASLAFPKTGEIAGNGTCNRFFGSVTIKGDLLQIDSLGGTKMACMGPAMAQESRYLTGLQKAQRYELHGDTLLIHVEGQTQPMRFLRLP